MAGIAASSRKLKRLPIRCWAASLLVMLMLPTTGVSAQDAASPPIQIEADRLEAESESRRVTFFDNVVARHADMVIYADRLEVAYGPEQQSVEGVRASGHVRVVRGDQVATSDEAVYDGRAQTIWMTGSPKVRQGQNFIEGSEITIFLQEGRSLVKREDGSRVHAFFSPPPASEAQP